MISSSCQNDLYIGNLASKLPASRLPVNSMLRSLQWPNFGHAIHRPKDHPIFGVYLVKNKSPFIGLGMFSSYTRSLKIMHNPQEIKNMQNENPMLEGLEFDDDDKEIERKRKIGRANKGRVPWNKGRKHSEETRERIRRRTKEALKEPKVRKKMSECPRFLSNQTKARIRASLTKLWSERLRWKRSREKFMQSWVEAIAKAAKVGSSDQQELEWDSYNRIKREIALQQQQEAAEKAKEKEMARLKAERAAQIKAERMARLAEKRKEREVNAKIKGESIRKRNKRSKEEIQKLVEFQEVKLKERLMKIHGKKSALNQMSYQHERSWEKIDVDFVKGEHLQKDISLADQIRVAKDRRAEQLLDKLSLFDTSILRWEVD